MRALVGTGRGRGGLLGCCGLARLGRRLGISLCGNRLHDLRLGRSGIGDRSRRVERRKPGLGVDRRQDGSLLRGGRVVFNRRALGDDARLGCRLGVVDLDLRILGRELRVQLLGRCLGLGRAALGRLRALVGIE